MLLASLATVYYFCQMTGFDLFSVVDWLLIEFDLFSVVDWLLIEFDLFSVVDWLLIGFDLFSVVDSFILLYFYNLLCVVCMLSFDHF